MTHENSKVTSDKVSKDTTYIQMSLTVTEESIDGKVLIVFIVSIMKHMDVLSR